MEHLIGRLGTPMLVIYALFAVPSSRGALLLTQLSLHARHRFQGRDGADGRIRAVRDATLRNVQRLDADAGCAAVLQGRQHADGRGREKVAVVLRPGNLAARTGRHSVRHALLGEQGEP